MDYIGGVNAKDIEWILSGLESFQREVGFVEFLLPKLVSKVGVTQPGYETFKAGINNQKSDAKKELARIKRALFSRLMAFDEKEATSLWKNVLEEIRAFDQDASISIFTSNYDLTFETAIENLGNDLADLNFSSVDYGFSEQFGRMVYDPTRDFAWNAKTIEFLKVHGSIDWHRDAKGQCSRSMSTTVPNDPDQMVILYPGAKGVAENEPFLSIHGRLDTRLAEADAAFVVGFAFRDAYINSIFYNALRRDHSPRVFYLNPLPMEKHPEGSFAPKLAGSYSAFRHVNKGIENKSFPMGLADLLASS